MRGAEWLWHDVISHAGRLVLLIGFVAGVSAGLVVLEQPIWILVAIVAAVVAAALGQGAYIQWSEADEQLRPFTDRRPLEAEMERSQVEGQEWLNICVHNPNKVPIKDCYGKVRSYRPRAEGTFHPPRPSHKFPWRSWGKEPGASRLLTTLAAQSEDYLDFAFAFHAEPDVFYTPTVSDDDMLPVRPSFPLPRGIYEVDIEIGSEKDIVPARFVTATIEFAGHSNFHCRLEDTP